jgi:hypothetical protein
MRRLIMVSYKEYVGDSGDEFNGNIISVKNEDGKYDMCASFFTEIPISPLSYRKEHPTKTAYHAIVRGDVVEFTIFSDWGEPYHFTISRDDPALARTYDYLESEEIPMVDPHQGE